MINFPEEAAKIKEELVEMIEALCAIPAPLKKEQARARFILRWLQNNGMQDAFIDSAGNVIFPYQCNTEKYIAFTAHMDTVFPKEEALFVEHDGNIAKCPGIGDDTTHLAAELLLARWVVEHRICFSNSLLFVWDTGEEGLGDLKGARALMEEYDGQIEALVALDTVYSTMINRAVGSVRYRIRIETEGGHSFRNFGNVNAIERAAALIMAFYQQQIPEIEDTHTTFNVGTISGGTSVNTIAQTAEFLYEFRSDSEDALEQMEQKMRVILQELRPSCRRLEVKEIGCRPAGKTRAEGQTVLEERWYKAAEAACPGIDVKAIPGSTDCNIPLSKGIPAICVGIYKGGAAHTYQEWIDYDSLTIGYEMLLRFTVSFQSQ